MNKSSPFPIPAEPRQARSPQHKTRRLRLPGADTRQPLFLRSARRLSPSWPPRGSRRVGPSLPRHHSPGQRRRRSTARGHLGVLGNHAAAAWRAGDLERHVLPAHALVACHGPGGRHRRSHRRVGAGEPERITPRRTAGVDGHHPGARDLGPGHRRPARGHRFPAGHVGRGPGLPRQVPHAAPNSPMREPSSASPPTS